MLIENSSDIVSNDQQLALHSGELVDALTLINSQILVLSENTLSVYRSLDSIQDPLGNGLLHTVALQGAAELVRGQDGRFMAMKKAGIVGLFDDKVILITPNDIQLFANRNDALRNQNELVRLSLG
jgi:hypothetical protein